jgi:predicted nucleotidyltransferase
LLPLDALLHAAWGHPFTKRPIWTGFPRIPYNGLMQKLQGLLEGVLNHYPDIKLCILFGSIASDRETPDSDLDIAVAGEKPLSHEKYLELMDALSASTNRAIDLVDLMVATGHILRHALSKGVVVQNLDKNLYARLISRMLFNQADMMPLYDRTLRERRRWFLDG